MNLSRKLMFGSIFAVTLSAGGLAVAQTTIGAGGAGTSTTGTHSGSNIGAGDASGGILARQQGGSSSSRNNSDTMTGTGVGGSTDDARINRPGNGMNDSDSMTTRGTNRVVTPTSPTRSRQTGDGYDDDTGTEIER